MLAAEQDAPVQARDEAFQPHLSVGPDHGEGAYRQLAAAAELAEEGPLGIHATMRGFVVDRGPSRPHLVARPHWIARAPWPTWGSIVEVASTSATSPVRPRRSSAA